MYSFNWKTKFKRDFKRLRKRGWDIDKIEAAFRILFETGELPEAYKPHPLRGEYKGCFDAHIEADWVLIYEVDEAEKIIILHRTGSHQDLFKKY